MLKMMSASDYIWGVAVGDRYIRSLSHVRLPKNISLIVVHTAYNGKYIKRTAIRYIDDGYSPHVIDGMTGTNAKDSRKAYSLFLRRDRYSGKDTYVIHDDDKEAADSIYEGCKRLVNIRDLHSSSEAYDQKMNVLLTKIERYEYEGRHRHLEEHTTICIAMLVSVLLLLDDYRESKDDIVFEKYIDQMIADNTDGNKDRDRLYNTEDIKVLSRADRIMRKCSDKGVPDHERYIAVYTTRSGSKIIGRSAVVYGEVKLSKRTTVWTMISTISVKSSTMDEQFAQFLARHKTDDTVIVYDDSRDRYDPIYEGFSFIDVADLYNTTGVYFVDSMYEDYCGWYTLSGACYVLIRQYIDLDFSNPIDRCIGLLLLALVICHKEDMRQLENDEELERQREYDLQREAEEQAEIDRAIKEYEDSLDVVQILKEYVDIDI